MSYAAERCFSAIARSVMIFALGVWLGWYRSSCFSAIARSVMIFAPNLRRDL